MTTKTTVSTTWRPQLAKIWPLCGALAPVVYLLTVILGGIIRPGYSHVTQAVSDLIATGAPNKALLDPLFALYNLLTGAFGLELFWQMRRYAQKHGAAIGALGALMLVIESAFGLLTLLFPEPAGGMAAAVTGTGTLHIIFAGLSSLTTMLAMLLLGFWFRNSQRLRSYGVYSFISVAAVFLAGGLAAFSVASQSPIAGLLERLTIGGFLQWLFAVALVARHTAVARIGGGAEPLTPPNRPAASL